MPNLILVSKSAGRCPRVLGWMKSEVATAHGVSSSAGTFGEEGGCQPGDWISLLCQPLQQSGEQASLLRGDAHALAINGIKPADCVGDWQKAARERLKALEMAEHTLGKAVARDSAQRLGVPDGVVDRRRPQFASERQKAFRVAGGIVAVAAAEVRHPAVALKWV